MQPGSGSARSVSSLPHRPDSELVHVSTLRACKPGFLSLSCTSFSLRSCRSGIVTSGIWVGGTAVGSAVAMGTSVAVATRDARAVGAALGAGSSVGRLATVSLQFDANSAHNREPFPPHCSQDSQALRLSSRLNQSHVISVNISLRLRAGAGGDCMVLSTYHHLFAMLRKRLFRHTP